MKKGSTAIYIIILILASLFSSYNSFLKKPSEFDNSLILNNGILGKNLVKEKNANSEVLANFTTDNEEPIFWDLDNGANITYNPIVLFVNYYFRKIIC